jgi:hypothetical protein
MECLYLWETGEQLEGFIVLKRPKLPRIEILNSPQVRSKLNTALDEAVRLGRDGLKKSRERVRSGVHLGKLGVEQGSQWMNAALATEYARTVDRYMGQLFASRATIYDKAMDRVYQETHIGGGDHRLFDGGHDPLGAWEAVSHANPDDTFLHEVGAYFVAIWKDMVTPDGLPIVTWDQDTFDALSHAAQDAIGVSADWVKDMVTFTATETIGAATGLLAVVLNWNKEDIDRFASLVGSFGLSSIASGNPFLLVISVVCLARSYQQAKLRGRYADLGHGVAKGSIGSAAFLGATVLVGGPAWVVLTSGVISAVIARKAFDHSAKAVRETDWKAVVAFALRFFRDYQKATRSGKPLNIYLPA